MLCLNAKVGERISVGDLVVVICRVGRSGRVRLGFDGPKAIPVVRESAKMKVRKALAAGVPLHAIERELDFQENQAAAS